MAPKAMRFWQSCAPDPVRAKAGAVMTAARSAPPSIRARRSRSSAGDPQISEAHSGVFGTPS